MYIIFVRFLSEYLIFFFIFPVLYFLWRKNWQMVINILTAFVLTWTVRKLANIIWYEPRPFIVDPRALLYYTKLSIHDGSFFSGHASTVFSAAGSVFWKHRKFGTLLFIMAAMVSLGRVLAGLHYPHDVIAGALAGITISYLVERLSPKIARRIRRIDF